LNRPDGDLEQIRRTKIGVTCIGENPVRAMLVQASWVLIRKDGAPRKWNAIASTGKEALAEYAEDIRQRQENLSYFIARYRKVADPGDLGL
jgi:hypothetical protein